jgi:hypothetical protein
MAEPETLFILQTLQASQFLKSGSMFAASFNQPSLTETFQLNVQSNKDVLGSD